MVQFDDNKPELGSFLASQEVRDNFTALSRANELRPRPMSEVDDAYPMKVYVEAGSYATDSQSTKVWTPPATSVFPEFTASTLGRVDLLYITLGGVLTISEGVEGSGDPPPYPANAVAIAEVTRYNGQTEIADVDIRDVRPLYVTSAAGFGINPHEEVFTATGVVGANGTIFTLTLFTYAPGGFELNVFSGGVRQVVNEDYVETSANIITFAIPQPLGAKVIVYKVGAASAQYLADLDDVNVATAEAVTDPDNNRPNPADRNNPFATLADVTGAIPFGAEHDSTTGVHGPRVNITQTAADRALSIVKGTGTGYVVYVDNSGSDNALLIRQTGAAGAVHVTQQGNADAITVVQSGGGFGLQLTQHSTKDAAVVVLNNTSSTVTGIRISRVINPATRQPLLSLEDIGGVTSVNLSVHSETLSIADGATNTSKFFFNTNSGECTISGGGNNNRLTISKTTAGTGDGINVTNQGTGRGIHVSNGALGPAVSIRNNYLGSANPDLYVDHDGLGNPGDVSVLWNGPASVADALHTHTMVENFEDLNDISADQSDAFRDVGAKRAAAINTSNPVASLADIYALQPKMVAGTYTGNGTSQAISTSITNPVTGLPETFRPDWVMLYNLDDNSRSGVYTARSVAPPVNGRYFTSTGTAAISITSSGFSLTSGDARLNAAGNTYAFIAMKGQS